MLITLNYLHLEAFKHSWPCHGLPDELDNISFEFNIRNGDLLDVIARDRLGLKLDSSEFDGSALIALSHNASNIAFPTDAD